MSRADAAVHTLEKEAYAKLSSRNILSLEGHILGKVLTIVDASVANIDQREAMKMLIKEAVWDTTNLVTKWMSEQEEGKGSSFPL